MYLGFQFLKSVVKYPISICHVGELSHLHGQVSRITLRRRDKAGDIRAVQRRNPRQHQRLALLNLHRQLKIPAVDMSENGADGGGVGKERRPVYAVPLRHVKSPGEERIVDNTVDRIRRILVLGYDLGQSPGAVLLERIEVDVDFLGLDEAALVEAIGDRLHRDGGGVDGFDGVAGGGYGGLDAFGG